MLLRRLTPLVALLAIAVPAATARAAPIGAPQPVASGLDTPWEVALVPDGRIFVTERPGRVRVIEGGSTLRAAPAFTDTSGVSVKKFLGLALHPNYAQNRLVYLYETYNSGGDRSRILLLADNGTNLVLQRVVFDGIRSDLSHDGGRMAFGPDGKLYVTTGDVHDPATPQNLASLNGKILRLNDDGSAPADNPFVGQGGNARFVWSYGHRHPQGLAFDAEGRLWSSEHGPSGEGHAPSGASCCRDEINLIVRGGNYGWPLVAGSQQRAGTIAPAASSGDSATWAPGGAAIASDGRLYVPMLKDTHLRQFVLAGDRLGAQAESYRGAYGRMRAATAGCRSLYFTTDGAGARVLRVAVDDEGYPSPLCRSGATPPPAPGPSLTSQLRRPARSTAAAATPALARLVARAQKALRRQGIRGLLRRRRLVARAGGFPDGTVVLRVERRFRARKALPAAVGARKASDRSTLSARARLTRRGRRSLRNAPRARLVVRASFLVSGQRTDQVARLALGRRGR